MSARSFFDTNILLYTDDRANPAKQGRALDLLAEHRRQQTGVVSLQVLQEYFTGATQKFHLDADVTRRKVELFAEFNVIIPEVSDVLAAIDLHRLHRLSFWDALIVQTAQNGSCSVLFSEDLQHGRAINRLRVVNPFV
jgi:predicted nucleic acid-binding protein